MPLILETEAAHGELFCDSCGVFYSVGNHTIAGRPDNCFCSEECAQEYLEESKNATTQHAPAY